jgi:hypothetical protein
LQLARLVERITRNFGEKRLTGAVFLDVAKAFDTVWIDGLLYKLTLLNFPSYIVHTISYLRGRAFEAFFQTATSSCRSMRAGMAIIDTSRKPTLLISYLDSYFNDLQRWMSEWTIAINVSKSTAIIFERAGRRFIQPRPVTLFGEPIKWVDTTRYLGVTIDIRLTWSPHIDQVRKKTAQSNGMLGPLLNRKSDLSVRNAVLLYKQLIRHVMDYACPAWRSAARAHVQRLQVLQSKCLRLATGAPWYVSNRQIHEDPGVPLFADHIRALRVSTQGSLTWGTPLYGNSADTYADRRLPPSPEAKAKGGGGQQASRGHRLRWPSRLNETLSALITRVLFVYPG